MSWPGLICVVGCVHWSLKVDPGTPRSLAKGGAIGSTPWCLWGPAQFRDGHLFCPWCPAPRAVLARIPGPFRGPRHPSREPFLSCPLPGSTAWRRTSQSPPEKERRNCFFRYASLPWHSSAGGRLPCNFFESARSCFGHKAPPRPLGPALTAPTALSAGWGGGENLHKLLRLNDTLHEPHGCEF